MKKILVLVGSLREGSWNQKVADWVCAQTFAGATLTQFDLHHVPFLHTVDTDDKMRIVSELITATTTADALLIISPEHNRGITAPLKNALDIISEADHSFVGLPALVLGASTGNLGTVSAQNDTKKTLLHLGMHVLGQPEIMIGRVQEKFSPEGELADEKTKEMLKKGVEELIAACVVQKN
jgi:NAD(P)H-dependent FMN reductase